MLDERIVGGIACSAVLALLPDVVAGTIDDDERAKVTLHLAGCSVCERFGGAYGAAVRALRASGSEATQSSAAAGSAAHGGAERDRLLARLAALPARSPARE